MIPAPRYVPRSSRGLGRWPLTPVTRVRIPYAVPRTALAARGPFAFHGRTDAAGRLGRRRRDLRRGHRHRQRDVRDTRAVLRALGRRAPAGATASSRAPTALLVGWAALSAVSARAVYAGVTENSIYIAEAARGQGVGRQLLQRARRGRRARRHLDDPDGDLPREPREHRAARALRLPHRRPARAPRPPARRVARRRAHGAAQRGGRMNGDRRHRPRAGGRTARLRGARPRVLRRPPWAWPSSRSPPRSRPAAAAGSPAATGSSTSA